MAEESPSKRRKVGLGHIKLLEEAERSSITRDGLGTLNSKDKDLWIIRLPREVEVSSLNGQEINLSGSDQRVSCEDKVYDLHTSTNNRDLCAPTILVPSSKPGKLKCALQAQGEVSLVQTVDILQVEVPPAKTSHDKVAVPQGLKLRWKPFGWREPYHNNVDGEQLHTTVPHRTSSKPKQKDKKRKKLK